MEIACSPEALPFRPIAIASFATALDESPRATLDSPLAKLEVPKAILFFPRERFAPLLNNATKLVT